MLSVIYIPFLPSVVMLNVVMLSVIVPLLMLTNFALGGITHIVDPVQLVGDS
jgi:hypothetical protein